MTADPMPARQHHYTFAHKALPNMILGGPARMLELLSSPMSTPFLLDIWESVGTEVGRGQHLPPDGLQCTTRESNGRRAIIISLPRPERICEAWFTAFLIQPESRKFLFVKRAGSVRYITLEHSETLDGQTRSVLGEWTREGTHLNMGDGPQPNLDAFATAIFSL